jgi:hypothetical protein
VVVGAVPNLDAACDLFDRLGHLACKEENVMTVPDATPDIDICKERLKRYQDAYQMQHEDITRHAIRLDANDKKIKVIPAMEKLLRRNREAAEAHQTARTARTGRTRRERRGGKQMNAQTDINLNQADCLRSVSDFGTTTVHNICNGSINEVPWGSADWVLASVLLVIGAMVILLFVSMAIAMIRSF